VCGAERDGRGSGWGGAGGIVVEMIGTNQGEWQGEKEAKKPTKRRGVYRGTDG